MSDEMDHRGNLLVGAWRHPSDSLLTSLVQTSADQASHPIVGIGVSAACMPMLGLLFSKIALPAGMAFVVIPSEQSDSDSIQQLIASTAIPFPMELARDGTVVLPDRIYVLPPVTRMVLTQGRLCAPPVNPDTTSDSSIDAFFISLAGDRGGQAIGVLGTGAKTDGVLGLAAIAVAGGVTFVLDHGTDAPRQPFGGRGIGFADFVVSAGDLGAELGKIARFGLAARPRHAEVPSNQDLEVRDGEAATPVVPEGYAIIRAVMHTVLPADISLRSNSLVRTIVARMASVGSGSSLGYSQLVIRDVRERDALAREVILAATRFYQDRIARTAWSTFVFPALAGRPDPQPTIRCWVVGCGTGEDAYVLAMELIEHFRLDGKRLQFQIFATDISEWSLAYARRGCYPASIADDVPADRLARYFTLVKDGYQISRGIRDLCVFAKHDFLRDVPFSRLDIIHCQHAAGHLNLDFQAIIAPSFHYALNPGGFLLLGAFEAREWSTTLFDVVDESRRLYRVRPATGPVRTAPIATERRYDLASPPGHGQLPRQSILQRAADQIVLGRCEPAGVLVNEGLDIVQYRGDATAFLETIDDRPVVNLLERVSMRTRASLLDAVKQARQHHGPIRIEPFTWHREHSIQSIALDVIPIALPLHQTCYLILFGQRLQEAPVATLASPSIACRGPRSHHVRSPHDEQLVRRELTAAQEQVLSLEEQLRVQAEQLKDAQDETQSSSEEYRSTNDELLLIRREVESANQELIVINEQLRATNVDLVAASESARIAGDVTDAIVDTMTYPLLVLSADLAIERTNQAFLNAFGLKRDEAVGRGIYAIGDGLWDFPALRHLLDVVLRETAAVDNYDITHAFGDIDAQTFRITARSIEGTDGSPRLFVLVLVDISLQIKLMTDLKSSSHELLRSNADLDHFAVVASHDLQEPLGVVSLYLEILKLQYGSHFDDKAREYMAHVSNGALRMTEMIRGILAYSRPGINVFERVQVDLAGVLTDVKGNLAIGIAKTQAIITSDPLPTVPAHQEQVTQLFQNLLGNALKYCSDKRRLRIHIGAHGTDNEWTIAFSDNGIGIKEMDFDAIFQPFHRAHTDRIIKGFGIGLTTCRKIVERHKGRIWVTSTPGKGSVFSFTIRA
jgi:two-component system CheB/CheR fusion protein